MENKNSEVGTKIQIDLNNRFDVRKLKKGEFIHVRALNSLLDRVDEILKSQPRADENHNHESSFFFDRRHDTITIQGERGSGKTTFILNTLTLLQSPQETDIFPKLQKISEKVIPLGCIDPTLIENKENLFILVLNIVRRKVEQYYAGENATALDGRPTRKYRDWCTSLKKLAEGLSLLDGVGSESATGEAWDDPNYILERGLSEAGSSLNLERNFHDFIKDSLELISPNKTAFVLAIDDVDTDFKRGWPVLEMLRRYLTSPKLIIILSGDIDLYSMLVRNEAWKNFDKQFLDRDPMVPERKDRNSTDGYDRSHNVLSMIDHIQGQYLLKILRSNHRIELASLDKIQNFSNTQTTILSDIERPLDDYLSELFENTMGFRLATEQLELRRLILRQPTRSALQIMGAYHRLKTSKGSSIEIGQKFARSFADIFIDVLGRYNISSGSLSDFSGRHRLTILAGFLEKNNLWIERHNFWIGHRDDDLNLALLTIGTLLTQELRNNVGLSLEFGLRICLPREIFEANLVDEKNRAKALPFLRLDSEEAPSQIARRAAPLLNDDYLETNPDKQRRLKAMRYGVVRLLRRITIPVISRMYDIHPIPKSAAALSNAINKKDPADIPSYLTNYLSTLRTEITDKTDLKQPSHLKGTWYNTIEALPDRLSGRMQQIVSLPASHLSTSIGVKGSLYSIYNLIGVITQFAGLKGTGNALNSEIHRLLNELSPIRGYPTPPWAGRGEGVVISDDEDISIEDDSTDGNNLDSSGEVSNEENLITEIAKWITSEPPIFLTPKVHAAIWTRLHLTLDSMTDELTNDRMFLGHLMHRMIIAYLNAILVEELRASNEHVGINLRNPLTTDIPFITNLNAYDKRIKEHTDALPFFQHMFSCPLWGAYINPEDEQDTSVWTRYLKNGDFKGTLYTTKFSIGIKQQRLFATFPNLYSILNSVPTINLRMRLRKPKNMQPQSTEDEN